MDEHVRLLGDRSKRLLGESRLGPDPCFCLLGESRLGPDPCFCLLGESRLGHDPCFCLLVGSRLGPNPCFCLLVESRLGPDPCFYTFNTFFRRSKWLLGASRFGPDPCFCLLGESRLRHDPCFCLLVGSRLGPNPCFCFAAAFTMDAGGVEVLISFWVSAMLIFSWASKTHFGSNCRFCNSWVFRRRDRINSGVGRRRVFSALLCSPACCWDVRVVRASLVPQPLPKLQPLHVRLRRVKVCERFVSASRS